MSELQELQRKNEELGRAWNEFKERNDKEMADLKQKASVAADIKEVNDRLNKKIGELDEECKGLRTALNRSQGGQGGETEETKARREEKAAHSAGFKKYARKGERANFTEAESKFMSVDSDANGGFVVPDDMATEIVKKVYESSPILSLASELTLSGTGLDILQDLDDVGAGWVGEVEERTETTTPQLREINIPLHEIYGEPKVTQKILDDAEINIESFLGEKIADKFSRVAALAAVSGNGVKKMRGFLTYDNGTGFNQVEQKETASSGTLGGDDIITLIYGLKGAYRRNARIAMNDQISAVVRKLKTQDLGYLWVPGFGPLKPATLLGFEIDDFQDMTGTVSAGNLVMAVADWKSFYQVVRKPGIRTLRDPYTQKGFVKFYSTMRIGGGVKNFEAGKILKVKA